MPRDLAQEARNKALVLEAFDALFNRRDFEAAEHYWSPAYIQHSAAIAPGRQASSLWCVGSRGGTRARSPWQRAIASWSMVGSAAVGSPRGSSSISFAWRKDASQSTGTSRRTRRRRSCRKAACRCSGRHFEPERAKRRRNAGLAMGRRRVPLLIRKSLGSRESMSKWDFEGGTL
jgi:hypothetical protein